MEARLEKLEREFDELKAQVNEIEKNAAVNKEQVKMIFNILNEIKASIKQIAEKMDASAERHSEKPTQLLWSIAGAVLTALIIAGLKFIN